MAVPGLHAPPCRRRKAAPVCYFRTTSNSRQAGSQRTAGLLTAAKHPLTRACRSTRRLTLTDGHASLQQQPGETGVEFPWRPPARWWRCRYRPAGARSPLVCRRRERRPRPLRTAMGPPSPHQSTRPAWCSSNATPANPTRCHALCESGREPLAAYLARFDIVVNCVLQDTAAPLMFVTDSDLAAFSPGSLIIDVSRDTGMGSAGHDPIICGPDVHRGRRHSLLRRGPQPFAAVELRHLGDQQPLLPHLRTVLEGPRAPDLDQSIKRAIEMRGSIIQTPPCWPSSTERRNTRIHGSISTTMRTARAPCLLDTFSRLQPPRRANCQNH